MIPPRPATHAFSGRTSPRSRPGGPKLSVLLVICSVAVVLGSTSVVPDASSLSPRDRPAVAGTTILPPSAASVLPRTPPADRSATGSTSPEPDRGCLAVCPSDAGKPSIPTSGPYDGWGNLTPYLGASPSGRESAAVAYDANVSDPEVVLFGGQGSGGALGDTWVYHNQTAAWTNVTPTPLSSSNSPSARYGASMVYDPTTGEVVLFGGSTGAFTGSNDPLLNDTWVYAGGRWTELCQYCGPPARWDAAAAFDPADGQILLFGGLTIEAGAYATLNDTWAFANGDWTPLQPTASPSARYGAAMTTNQSSGEVVLFGGCGRPIVGTSGGCDVELNDTWNFTGGAWARVLPPPAVAPPVRTESGLASSAASGAIVLYGGEGAAGRLNDTWQLGGSAWSDLTGSLSQAPSSRDGVGLTFDNDSGSDYFLLFGGWNGTYLNETWVYPSPFAPLRLTQPVASAPVLDADQTLNLSVTVAGGAGGYKETWYGLPHGCGTADRTTLSCPVSVPSGSTTVSSIVVRAVDAVGSTVWSAPTLVTVNPKPVVSVMPAPGNGNEGEGSLSVNLTAVTVGGTSPFTFDWEFGDGSNGTGVTVTHLYHSVGVYIAWVWANDSVGDSASAPNVPIRVTAPVAVTVVTKPSGSVTPGTRVTIQALAANGFSPYAYAWSGLPPGCVGASVSKITCTVNATGSYAIGVTVTDSLTHVATNSTTLTVQPAAGPAWYTSPGLWIGLEALAAVLIAAIVVIWYHRSRQSGGSGGAAPPP